MNELAQHSNHDAHGYERDQVIKIINSVISKVEQNETIAREAIFNELQDLQKIIDETRHELGATQPGEINDKHIPTATDELDAIVSATAEATGTIMDSCEHIQEKIGSLDDAVQSVINDEIIKIFEACSFQDITGQRITKVVSTLKTIEDKVSKILNIFDQKVPGLGGKHQSEPSAEPKTQAEKDEALLNGPQMADKAISQDDIDKLLSEFD